MLTLSAMVISGSLVNAQRRVGQPMSGTRPNARPSRRMSPPPPAIRNPIQPSTNPVVPPAVAVPPPSLLSPLRPSSPFEARPRTYAPRYDPRYDRIPGGGYRPYFGGGGFGFGDELAPAPDVLYPAESNGQATYQYPQTRELPTVAAPHGPDTFYVIPGCYAGNHMPTAQQLPSGCDIKKLKTTPIR
jgi:hypothetical protein